MSFMATPDLPPMYDSFQAVLSDPYLVDRLP
jgi:hypothetical protein